MRVAFLGNAAWSVPSLEALARSGHEVALVATRAPRPAGRGNRLRPTAVADAARRLDLPLSEIETVKEGPGFDALVAARPEVLVVVAYGEIVPPVVLDLPSVAPVNVHFSLLPKLRGAAPVQRAILEGMGLTGVTTIRMDAGMDTGPILLQREEPVRPEDDAGSLGERLAESGADLLVATLDALREGSVEERPQDHALATVAPKIKPDDRVLDWSEPAELVLRRIRAMSPEPGAETRFRGKLLKVYGASRVGPLGTAPSSPDGRTGHIGLYDEGPGVWVGDGVMILDVVQPEGRRRMTGQEFARGYRPEPGEILE